MTDNELDRVLTSALDVEPRADFLARVRMGVASEPAPATRTPWLPAAAVAAAAIIMAVSLWPDAVEEPANRRTAAVAAARRTDISSATRIEPGPAKLAKATASRPVNRPAGEPDSLPAPMISIEDAGSLALLAASAQQGIAAELLSPSDGHDRSIEVATLEVPLLGAVLPIEMNALDAGERQ